MTRILMTGSRDWTNREIAREALLAGLTILDAPPAETTLIHGGAKGADLLLADIATRLKMPTEEHLAKWEEHSADCPPAHQGADKCKMAGHRRNAVMVATGADLCLAFPTHGYTLAPGASRTGTSRGTWSCAEKARAAGIPTIVVWGRWLYPFGDEGVRVLAAEAARKALTLGPAHQLSINDAWLPF